MTEPGSICRMCAATHSRSARWSSQPLEDGIIRIVRARWAVTYPARFQLIAAANPCPCGFDGDELKGCSCQPALKDGYKSRLRGPVIDRVDLQCTVARIKRNELFEQ